MRILRGVRFAAHLGLELHLRKEETIVRREYGTAGYAHITDAEREAIHFLARTEGILVDPVYTGRAFGGLLDLIRRGDFTKGQRVLFWHTGGTAALFAFADKLAGAS